MHCASGTTFKRQYSVLIKRLAMRNRRAGDEERSTEDATKTV